MDWVIRDGDKLLTVDWWQDCTLLQWENDSATIFPSYFKALMFRWRNRFDQGKISKLHARPAKARLYSQTKPAPLRVKAVKAAISDFDLVELTAPGRMPGDHNYVPYTVLIEPDEARALRDWLNVSVR